jgi:hypothetical protein
MAKICNVRGNTINALVDKGIVSNDMKILDYFKFIEQNQKYTDLAKNKYGVQNPGTIFTTRSKEVPRIQKMPYYRTDETKLGDVYAVPNDTFFDELQTKHTEYHNQYGDNENSNIAYNLLNSSTNIDELVKKAEKKYDFKNNKPVISLTEAKNIVDAINHDSSLSGIIATRIPVTQGDNILHTVVVKSSQDTIFDINRPDANITDKVLISDFMDSMIGKFEGMSYQWITPKDLNQEEHAFEVDRINSYVKNGIVYLVEGRATKDMALEELLHPFVEGLYQDNKSIFVGLLIEANKSFPEMVKAVSRVYTNVEDQNKEIVTRAIQASLKMKLEDTEEGEYSQLKYLVKRFLDWLTDKLQMLFGVDLSSYRLTPYNISKDITLQSLAEAISKADTSIESFFIDIPTYNISEIAEDDERFSKQDKNIERIQNQLFTVKSLIDAAIEKNEIKKADVLNKVYDNLNSSLDDLIAGKKTVSVSRLVGGGALDLFIDNKKYQNFGNFLHSVVQTLQEQYIGDNKMLPSRAINEAFVNDLLRREELKDPAERFTTESGKPTDITGLEKKTLIEILKDVMKNYDQYIIGGYTIIPEITVVGKDKAGRSVIGRIDTLAISKDGKTEIIDLKTKKLYTDADWGKINHQLNKRYRVESSADSAAEFFAAPSDGFRNSYENWDIQLGVYEAIFNQMGITIDKKKIVGLLYLGESLRVDLPGSLSTSYDFKFTEHAILTHESSLESYDNVSDRERYEKFSRMIKNVMAIAEKTQKEKIDQTRTLFDLTTEQETELLDRISNSINNEIDKTRKLRNTYKKESGEESELYKSYNERLESLNKVKDILTKSNVNWDVAYKLSLALNFLDDSYETMMKVVDDVKNEKDLNKKAQILDNLRRRANGLDYFINELAVVVESLDRNKNKAARDTISKIKANINAVTIAYNEVGADFMIQVIKEMEGTRYKTVLTKDREDAIRPRLKYLKEKLETLKSGNAGIKGNLSKAKFWAMGNLTNTVRSIFGLPGETFNQIKALELQIKSLELELEGVKMNDDEIRNYVEGVLENEQSLLYMGNKVTFVSNVIAAASNRDLGVSAFANFLKSAEQGAQREYVNFIEKMKFQQELDKFAKGENDMTTLSKKLTEVRNIKELQEDGTLKDTPHLSFIDPITEEYRNVFKDFREKLFEINTKIREANVVGMEAERKALIKEKSKLVENHRKWKLENTVMPLIDEVYALENMLPAEYREKRAEILEELDAIRYKVGYNNEEMMTEEDTERIAELEVEMQRLKIEYLKDNIEYKDYIEKLDKYYSYDTNWNFFERLKSSKMIQYGEDSPEYKKWLDENTNKVPNQLYYDRLEEIFDEMFEIIQTNEDVQELRKRQKEILASVKRRGYSDVRFLTSEEKQEYTELEDMIKEIIASSERPDYSVYEQEDLKRLRDELSRLKVKVPNPFYEKEYLMMKQSLDQKFDFYKQQEENLSKNPDDKQLQRNLKLAYENFLFEEEEFEKWYNENHMDVYESRLFSEDRALNPKPRIFNLVDIPISPKYFDVKPNSKYTLRKLRVSPDGVNKVATNPEYQEDVYGYPLPKGLKNIDGVMTIERDSQYINPSYKVLTGKADDFAFYNFLVNNFIKMQKDTYGKNLGYFVPGFEATSLEIYKKNNIKGGIQKNFDIWKQKNFTVNSPYDRDVNEYQSDIDRVRFKHNKPLPIEQQSENAIGAVLKWYEEAFINRNVGKVQPLANSAISYLESIANQLDDANVPDKELRKKELATVIGVLKNEYNKIIKGETKESQGQIARIIDTSLRGLSLTRMGLDIPNQIGNLFSGNVQIFLGGHKSSQYSSKNLVWAKSKIYGRNGLMGSLIKDFDKISGKSFMTKMYMYFNPQQDQLKHLMDKSLSRNDRVGQSVLDLEFLLWMQDKGEMEISSTIWLSIMDNRKVEYTDDKGNKSMVNAWEAYGENKDGEIIIKPGYNWTKQDEAELLRNMYSEIRRTQGNYADIDKTKVENNVIGRLGMFFRKYLVPAVQNRFGSLREDHEAAQISMGYYNALFKAFKYFGFGKTVMSLFKKDQISSFYSQRVFWAAREMVITAALYLIGSFIKDAFKSIADEPDDDKTIGDIALMNMMAVFIKVDRETRSLVPLPMFGGLDNYATEFTSFTNAGSDAKVIFNLLSHTLAIAGAQVSDAEWINQKAYYQKAYSQFEKGDPRIYKDLEDVSGIMNIYNLFNPETRVMEGFKRR